MRKLILSSLLLALLLTFGGIYYIFQSLRVEISIKTENPALGKTNRLELEIKPSFELPFGEVEIVAKQGNLTEVLYKGPITSYGETLIFEPQKGGFKEGKLLVEGYLHLPFKRGKIFSETFVVDLTPPSLEILEKPRYLKVGEPGVLTLKSSEDLKIIRLMFGEASFPLIRVKGNIYKTTFTVPLFALKTPESFYVEAEDFAGNRVEKFLPVPVRVPKFRAVKIELDNKTLERIVLKFFDKPENLVGQFKVINEEFRKEDEAKIHQIGKNSEGKLFAKGAFLQLPGSAVTARYGDHRFYYYEGKLISESFHKGLDLAKYRHAPVVAANDGRVIFVGKLKIYGNTVIIDHGFGVQTLYGHLLDFKVKEGDIVKKGQVIGRTDTTGLALGDHLHFGVLVWGYAVNPIYFFDPKYLKYYFYEPLKKTVP